VNSGKTGFSPTTRREELHSTDTKKDQDWYAKNFPDQTIQVAFSPGVTGGADAPEQGKKKEGTKNQSEMKKNETGEKNPANRAWRLRDERGANKRTTETILSKSRGDGDEEPAQKREDDSSQRKRERRGDSFLSWGACRGGNTEVSGKTRPQKDVHKMG